MNIKLLNYCKTSLAKLGKDYCGLQFLSLSDLLYWYMCTLMILCHGIDFVFTHFSHKTSIIMTHQVCDLHANFHAFQTSSFEIEVYI